MGFRWMEGWRMSEFPDTTGKIIAKMTIETINEPGLWGEIFDRLTVLFTDGSEVKFRSMFCSTQHSTIINEVKYRYSG